MQSDKELTGKIIGCAMHVHTQLGPGLLESSYQECLHYCLTKAGLLSERQVPLALVFEEVKLEGGYRVDLLVEKKVIIEIKSIEAIAPVHVAQILTYLKLSNNRIGLLINFNVAHLRDGIKRIVNGYE